MTHNLEIGEFVWVSQYDGYYSPHRELSLGIYLGPNEQGDAARVLVSTEYSSLELDVPLDVELHAANPRDFKKKYLRQALALLSEYTRTELAKLRKQTILVAQYGVSQQQGGAA
jgi:hypothetical protein